MFLPHMVVIDNLSHDVGTKRSIKLYMRWFVEQVFN